MAATPTQPHWRIAQITIRWADARDAEDSPAPATRTATFQASRGWHFADAGYFPRDLRLIEAINAHVKVDGSQRDVEAEK